MKMIKKLAEMIEDELDGAEEYVEEAIHHKEDFPEVAQTFLELAHTELGHVDILHNQVVRLIEQHRKEHGDPPAAMLAVWDYAHEKHMAKYREIKALMLDFRAKS